MTCDLPDEIRNRSDYYIRKTKQFQPAMSASAATRGPREARIALEFLLRDSALLFSSSSFREHSLVVRGRVDMAVSVFCQAQ